MKENYTGEVARAIKKAKGFIITMIAVYVGVLVVQAMTDIQYPFFYISVGLGIVILVVLAVQIRLVRNAKRASSEA